MTINLDEARLHLELLTGQLDAAVSWQTFDDQKARSDRRLARSFHGRLQDVLPKLKAAQARGAGVFAAVNETDGTGRRLDNMVAARALFLDLDGAPLPDYWPVVPDLVIHCSAVNGIDKFQCWWFIEPTDDFDGWMRMQKAMALRYGGDLKCALTTQVGRCAGFLHQKDPAQPWRVRIIADNAFGARHDLGELVTRFGFDLSTITIPVARRAQVERPPPLHGWDSELDIVAARRLLADEGAWTRTSDGAVSIFKMACRLRDLGISQALAVEMVEQYAPALPAQAEQDVRYIERKVGNAYAYARGDAGADSIEADRARLTMTDFEQAAESVEAERRALRDAAIHKDDDDE